jgi:CheY-like chemotaxis protein
VARAHDPEQALAMVSQLKPQLFVVDLALPGHTSLPLIERIRALAEHEHTPIAVLSASALGSDDRARLDRWVQLIAHKDEASEPAFFAQLRRLTPPRPRLLLVDDSEMNRKVIRAMLKAFPLEVIEAADAATGLASARAQPPDVILMDIQLPGMDGLTATMQLKAAPETRSIPVIAVTAHAMAGDPERALEAGCLAYVSKPISRKRLTEALDLALGGTGWRGEARVP